MKTLNRKIWRDLWRLRAQALAISLVISSGVAILVMSLSTYHSLSITQEKYYKESLFADIFVHCKRAPMYVVDRINAIDGVKQVSPRVTAFVNLLVPNFNEPILGHFLSVPDIGDPIMNKPYLRKGRWIQPFRDNEIILSEAFANAHHLSLGDQISAVINGRFKNLTIVGIALSSEHIYQIAPGAIFPDYKRYGVIWMAKTPLGTAFDLDNAFNDLIVTLQPKANPNEVMRQIDLLLKPYGGQISYERADQQSHRFLSEELKQLATMSILFPIIFFGIAAFLLNIVIARMIATQREQIALLKAFGYRNSTIGLHFLGLVSIVVGIGILIGLMIGVWFGHGLSQLYSQFYRFPYLVYELRGTEILLSALISLGVSGFGAWFAVQRAVALQPAEAMRPPTPPQYRSTWLEQFYITKLDATSRMVARNLIRRPIKSILSVLGIAFACGILMVGNFQQGALNHMVEVQYGKTQRQDISVTFSEPTATKALSSLRGLPGVEFVEGHRYVPVQLNNKQHSYRTNIHGFPEHAVLERPINRAFEVMRLPEKGLVLTDYLGSLLDVKLGDTIQVNILEGHQRTVELPVVGFCKQYLGLSALARRSYVNELMKEGPAINAANLAVDSSFNQVLYPKLQEMPQVVGISIRERMIQGFYDTLGDTILIFTFIVSILGGILSFGIIFNNARIGLAERIRELATMRVLGFYNNEISILLLGELWFLTIIALPLGCVVGYYLCLFLSHNLQSDLYRVPLVLTKASYLNAIWIVIAATAATSVILLKSIANIDMIRALKARE